MNGPKRKKPQLSFGSGPGNRKLGFVTVLTFIIPKTLSTKIKMKLGLLSIFLMFVLVHFHLGAFFGTEAIRIRTRGDPIQELRALVLPRRMTPPNPALAHSMTLISHQRFARPDMDMDNGNGNRMEFEYPAIQTPDVEPRNRLDLDDPAPSMEDYPKPLEALALPSKTGNGRLAKRTSENNAPWNCQPEYTWTNLGSNRFPRFVKTALCTGTCFNGNGHCVPRQYTVKVLETRGSGDERVVSAELPYPINETAKLINVHVNSCCECRLGPAPDS